MGDLEDIERDFRIFNLRFKCGDILPIFTAKYAEISGGLCSS
jgi:hypothetical protein